MGIANKQLEAILKEISERFKSDPHISVQPGEGSPPDRYEVTYTITGVQQGKNKEIQVAKQHSIVISIPFGFPHFPPNCKPLSPIFHPDFDQAAICISDFWEKDRTISDLIIHIGHMISGEIFSTGNAFNENAVLWYQQHKDELPFEILDFSSVSSSPVAKDDALAALDTLELETIAESDFKSDFSAFAPEAPVVQQELPPEAIGIDMDLFKLLVKQKRYCTLQKQLDPFSSYSNVKKLDELRNSAAAELAKAEQLFQQGRGYEQQGQPGKALETFKTLAATVSDYPEIEENIKRAEEAIKILHDFNKEPGSDFEAGSSVKAPFLEGKKTAEKESPTFFDEQPRTRILVLPLVVAGASVVLISMMAFLFLSNTGRYNQAKQGYNECQALQEQDNYIAADQKCNEALLLIKEIQFVKGGEKAELAQKIQETLNSQRMQQGLAGKVLRNGHYVSRSDDEALAAFYRLSDEGDTFLANFDWLEAKNRYQQALLLLAKSGTVDKALAEKIPGIKKNMAFAQVNLLMNSGKKFNENGEYEKAGGVLEQALDEAKALDDSVRRSTVQSIESTLSVVRFLNAKKNGDALFAAGNWQNAAEQYNKALDIAKNIQNPPAAELADLNENVSKADLFAAIQQGKEAFDRAQWDEAIRKYEYAIELLNENSKSLKQVGSEENRQKISRIMLQASVIRDKQEVARNLKEGKFKLAIDRLTSIIDSVTKSPFNKEEDFRQVVRESQLSIAEARQNQVISECTTYLAGNYKELFVKNFTATRAETLSDPKASFVKKIDERLLFKVECTESGQGKPLRLIMNYLYDPASRQWKFYTDAK
jgi:tetratricopeptide (TPR) repeat protein